MATATVDAFRGAQSSPHTHGRASSMSRSQHHTTPQHVFTETAWHFPFGPSSKFHKSERPVATNHRRHNSYTPYAPRPTPERRPHHRRTSSSAQVSLLSSPPRNEGNNSPLAKKNAIHNNTTTKHAPGRSHNEILPRTPVKCAKSPSERLRDHDSPFSDYYTDDAPSIDHPPTFDSLAPQTQQLLIRMNRIQARLLRDRPPTSVFNIVESGTNRIEREIAQLSSAMSDHSSLADSGVYMDDISHEAMHGERVDVTVNDGRSVSQKHEGRQHDDLETFEQRNAKNDFLLLKSRRIMADVTKAQEQLRSRWEEAKGARNDCEGAIEQKDGEIARLQSENDVLRSELVLKQHEMDDMISKMTTSGEAHDERADGQKEDDQAPERLLIGNESKVWLGAAINTGDNRRRRRHTYGAYTGHSTFSRPSRDNHTLSIGPSEEAIISDQAMPEEPRRSADTEKFEGITQPSLEDAGTQTDNLAVVSGDASTQTDNLADASEEVHGICHRCALWIDDTDHQLEDATPVEEQSQPDLAVGSVSLSETRDDHVDEPTKTLLVTMERPGSVRTAWSELWQSLAELTGMDDDRF